VSVTAGDGNSFPSHNSGNHSGGPVVRTSGGTSRGGGANLCWKSDDCHGWSTGGGMEWPADFYQNRSGPESGQNALMGLHLKMAAVREAEGWQRQQQLEQ
jgi:hypothetical protein